MKRRLILIFLFIALFFVGLINNTKAQTSSCIINSVDWDRNGPQTVAVGQNVLLANITGTSTNCAGLAVGVDIYDSDAAFLDYITTATSNFNSAGTSTGGIYHTFTQAEWDKGYEWGERDDLELFFEVKVYDSAGNVIPGGKGTSKQPFLILLRPPSPGACVLTTANWVTNFCSTPIVGSSLHMRVTGSGCSGQLATFTIRDDVWGPNNYIVGQIAGPFNTAGTAADLVWLAQGVAVQNQLFTFDQRLFGTYQFFFEAQAVGSNNVTSTNFPITVNSGTGCINCNLAGGLFRGQCVCADRYTQVGGLNTCMLVCQPHKGDALADNASGCTVGGPTNGGPTTVGINFGSGKPGEPVPLNFNLTNPLYGGATNVLEVGILASNWIFNLAIPIVTITIIYAGVRFLISRGNPGEVGKAKQMLLYAVIGLAVVIIGKGFIALVESILRT